MEGSHSAWETYLKHISNEVYLFTNNWSVYQTLNWKLSIYTSELNDIWENLVDHQVVLAWPVESKINDNVKKFSSCPCNGTGNLVAARKFVVAQGNRPMELLSPAYTHRNTLDIYYSVSSDKTPMDYMSLWGSSNGNEYPTGAHKNLLVHFYTDIHRATAPLVWWHQRKTKSDPLSIQKNNVIPEILLRPLQPWIVCIAPIWTIFFIAHLKALWNVQQLPQLCHFSI